MNQEKIATLNLMLTLYMRPTCSYSTDVLHAANALELSLELKNIANPEHAKELIARGGKQQVPYLVDEERGVEMYESRDIIAYLKKEYPSREEASS